MSFLCTDAARPRVAEPQMVVPARALVQRERGRRHLWLCFWRGLSAQTRRRFQIAVFFCILLLSSFMCYVSIPRTLSLLLYNVAYSVYFLSHDVRSTVNCGL
ncbi:hypothetical protein C8J57DRAFT_1719240 [Mycena rebaudengoi]|nr:hypothetical protein C8J57DRAFT_1719240 [Mycena rebaudengoi]